MSEGDWMAISMMIMTMIAVGVIGLVDHIQKHHFKYTGASWVGNCDEWTKWKMSTTMFFLFPQMTIGGTLLWGYQPGIYERKRCISKPVDIIQIWHVEYGTKRDVFKAKLVNPKA